ncbi:MAG TPA: ATP-binding cassette domain-containing protein [Baekduia sp.]|uniref:ATP-binding cassette domain-containing protein n=1 Tax=Baekduia sp. TaxID=2600305 RepID=UPI002BBE6BC5|nr:ATP-binding cassette domain-containing protein [Baekduia sp.]HMJ34254.1 ATP-binding cassette domain-containing protein [Baekduia sp.]
MSAPVLKLEDVRRSFGGVRALRGVSFEVVEGEVHALLGENGAGKSTLMAIAAGALAPDSGHVLIGGVGLDPSPSAARDLGVAVVYQHPAVVDHLTVAENMALVLPRRRRPRLGAAVAWAAEHLALIEADIDPALRGEDLTVAERQMVEIAKAMALNPKVLILDEPTAALNAAEVERLFAQVGEFQRRGTAIVYISHRIPEVMRIADRITVLRNGESRGTFPAAGVSEDEILHRIVGRELSAVFPAKATSGDERPGLLDVEGLSNASCHDVSFTVRAREILGLAGAEGNGQRQVMRALGGLESHDGRVAVAGPSGPTVVADVATARAAGVLYIPADRAREGLFAGLSVRENAAASSLGRFARAGVLSRPAEHAEVRDGLAAVAVKAASPETGVTTLSGGNQQKVVFARTLLSAPTVLLCDEPTQGVDPGARAEIYRLLRELADSGKGVVVLSSDAVELEGLCDRVAVFSRGHLIATLDGDAITEEAITRTSVASSQARASTADAAPRPRTRGSLRHLARSDHAPTAVLLAVVALLGAYTASSDASYLSAVNLQSMLFLAAALVFVSLGQLTVLLTGGIDLSVGAMMALTVVLLSFLLSKSGAGAIAAGVAVALGAGLVVGAVNAALVRLARISPIITTVATLTILAGIALLLRPSPDGVFDSAFMTGIQQTVLGVPIAFLVAIAVAVACELVLRRTGFGLALRAVGSDEASAHRIGVPVGRTVMAAYVLCALFATLAGILLAGQVGLGDPGVGGAYTLSSVAAVVLGGASIYGGRGSYVGAMLGALLTTQVLNAITFLHLGQEWQYWLPGGLVLIAACAFARLRTTALVGAEAAA